MTTITEDDVKTLIPLPDFLDYLKPFDNLGAYTVDKDSDSHLSLPEGWNDKIKEAEGTDLTTATLTIDGVSSQLTKDAVLEITSGYGLTKDYVSKTPGPLVGPHVDWWMHNHEIARKLLRNAEGHGLAWTKANVVPFSTATIAENVAIALGEKYKCEPEDLMVDYKFQNDLRRTAFRMIVPGSYRYMASQRHTAENPDRWSVGVQLTNSVVGEGPLSISGYLFAWQCTNGMVSTHASSGNYNRRRLGQEESTVYDWAEEATKDVIDGLDHELDTVEDSITNTLKGEMSTVVQDVFKTYKPPQRAREGIINALLETADASVYGLANAITQAANNLSVSDNIRTKLMEIGSDVVVSASTRCDSCHRMTT